MIKHIACLLNIEEEEVHHQFPMVCSLLPIDRSPPVPTSVLTPDTLMMAYMSPTFNNIDVTNLWFSQCKLWEPAHVR